jgi:hypothetical protein
MWWHAVTYGRGSEGETGEWSGQPVPFTLPLNMVYPALLPLMRTPRLPVVDWTDAPADLNGLIHFAERISLVSARMPSHFNWPLRTVNIDSYKQLPLHLCYFHTSEYQVYPTAHETRTLTQAFWPTLLCHQDHYQQHVYAYSRGHWTSNKTF